MQTNIRQTGTAPGEISPGFDPAVIQRAVEDICESTPFRATRQCQDLLRYVVTHSLTGQDQFLRERVIGAEVFKRTPDYDPGEDPVVRNRAAEVRKRLAQYYHATSGLAAVHIDIPSGSYRATFTWLPREKAEKSPEPSKAVPTVSAASTALVEIPLPAPVASVPLPASPVTHVPVLSQRKPQKWLWAAVCILLLAAIAITLIWRSTGTKETAFKRFWAPLLDGPKPVLICMGTNAVYRLSNQFMASYFLDHPEKKSMGEIYVDWKPGQQLDTHDLQRAWNSFVALGDVAASSDLVAAITRQGKAFQQRFPPDISFSELQNSPSVLVGGFNNAMAMTLSKDLRFQLSPNNSIEDTQAKSGPWMIRASLDSHDTEDYAIVYRLLDSKTGKPVLGVAGIGQYGTQAAAAFVSSPQLIRQMAANAPSGWENKNMELVLHVKIIDFRPIKTDVVESYYW